MSDQSLPARVASLIREDVLAMASYHVPDARGLIKLDAMENPYRLPEPLAAKIGQTVAALALNRYPTPHHPELAKLLRQHQGVPDSCDLVLGNGSDELIHLILQACARPGACALAPVPGFVMYQMSARLNGLGFVGVPLRADFSLDRAAMLAAIELHQPAVIFLAFPNNPTGNLWDRDDIMAIVAAAPGLVVIDEAYQPFAQDSLAELAVTTPHVVVLRTLSKWGLAGIRLGYLFGHAAWISAIDRVRPPYNINVMTAAVAAVALEHAEVFQSQAEQIIEERERLLMALTELLVSVSKTGASCQVFPSAANFLLARVPDAARVQAHMKQQGVLIKSVEPMHPLLQGCVRISVGLPRENEAMLRALASALSEYQA